MKNMTLWMSMGLLLIFTTACAQSDSQAPRVVSLSPENMSVDVDPSLTEISVTFNEEMMDQSWSWAYTKEDNFPQMTGQAYYADNNTRNVLPVKLEPNKVYIVWINSQKFNGFKDKNGNAALPFQYKFKTK